MDDDLRMIRDVLGDVPAPSAETVARSRAALVERARNESALSTSDGVTARGLRRARAAAGLHRAGVARPAGRKTGWWRWSIGGGLGISGAVAAALVVPMLGPTATVPEDPDRGGSTSQPATVAIGDRDDAGTVLRLAAANARLGSAVEFRAGQFIYRVVEEEHTGLIGDVEGDGPVAMIRVGRRHEMWSTIEGLRAMRTRISNGTSRTPVTPADAEAVRKLGYDLNAPPQVEEDGPAPGNEPPPGCTTCWETRDPGELYRPTPAYLASLPTDPVRLLDTLRTAVGDRNKHSPDQEVFTAALDLLKEADPIMPPDVRAALYQAVALIPGVERIDGQVELGGRQGIAIGRVNDAATLDDSQREELVFDTTGRELLGFRIVTVRASRGLPAGTVVFQSAPRYAFVDQIGETR
ncbi:CU044_5270 family protein [Plantactinospora sonchi]|uniref:CU044_5270 family protein n=1 Tax=Plantactinospora sonchi TaxID=1544735 RepID=A0ABU7RRZ4_9ACTN